MYYYFLFPTPPSPSRNTRATITIINHQRHHLSIIRQCHRAHFNRNLISRLVTLTQIHCSQQIGRSKKSKSNRSGDQKTNTKFQKNIIIEFLRRFMRNGPNNNEQRFFTGAYRFSRKLIEIYQNYFNKFVKYTFGSSHKFTFIVMH